MITRSPNTRYGRGTAQSGGTGGGVLPSWVPAANTVAVIPEVNSFVSIDPGDSAANGWSYGSTGGFYGGNWHKIIDDFSGGVYNPYYGTKGSMVFHGGGHVANNWNGIVVFDLETLTYARLMEGCTNCYPADPNNAEYADGQPVAPHSYDNLVILGPEAGYSKGALITPVVMAGAYEGYYAGTAVHLFDFNNPGAKWTRLAAHNAAFSAQPGGASAYDADLQRVWWVSNVNEIGYQQYFDLATNAHVKIWLTYPQSLGSSSPDSKCLRYDSARKLLIHIDSSSDGTTRRGAYFDTTGAITGWQGITFSAAFPAPSGGQGFAFDRAADGTYLCNVQADLSKVYRLTIPTVLTDPWPVSPITYTGDSLAGAYVLGKRWSYVPALESFVCKPSGAAAHQIYRP